jgi:hypothetical protein
MLALAKASSRIGWKQKDSIYEDEVRRRWQERISLAKQ